MRDDIRRAFADSTEAPHPALGNAIRDRIAGRPTVHSARPLAVAAAAAGLVIAAGGLALLAPRQESVQTRPAAPRPSALHSPAAELSPAPATPAPATGAPIPAAGQPYSCDPASGGQPAPLTAPVSMTAARVGTAAGYDRFVIEYDGPVPVFQVSLRASPTFTQDGSGRQLTLQGEAGVLVRVEHGTGYPNYRGPTDFTPAYPALKEARLTGDFEGVTQWGLGVSSGSCLRVFTLSGPDRLVIDVQQRD